MVSGVDTLSVVIVNYRREDLLAQALTTLRASLHQPEEVVIVDVEPTNELTLALEPPERVLVVADNPGYAAACNRGAAMTQGAWLLFMNADTFVDPSCIGGVLAAAAAEEDVGIATCRLDRPDGSIDHACHRGLPSVFDSLAYKARLDRLAPRSRRLGHYRLSWLDLGTTHDVEACTGAFLLIRRDLFDRLGGWDEAYRFYAEDLDLCARVRGAGYRVLYVGSERAIHVKGASSYLQSDAPTTLTEEQARTKRRARAASIDAHARFYEVHMKASTSRLVRPLVDAMFALQRRQAGRGR